MDHVNNCLSGSGVFSSLLSPRSLSLPPDIGALSASPGPRSGNTKRSHPTGFHSRIKGKLQSGKIHRSEGSSGNLWPWVQAVRGQSSVCVICGSPELRRRCCLCLIPTEGPQFLQMHPGLLPAPYFCILSVEFGICPSIHRDESVGPASRIHPLLRARIRR